MVNQALGKAAQKAPCSNCALSSSPRAAAATESAVRCALYLKGINVYSGGSNTDVGASPTGSHCDAMAGVAATAHILLEVQP